MYYSTMSLVDWIYPVICVGCGKEGEYICGQCQKKLVRPEAMCPMCCKPSLDGWTHARCKTRYGMERLLVGLPYRGMVQECLKKVKYKSAWEIVSLLFGLWHENWSDTAPLDLVVTQVPMWKQKARARGFDQAELVAKLVAKNYKVPYLVMLTRVRETQPMFGLKKAERYKNVRGAFELMHKYTNEQVSRRIVLVDDVWTTGATMRECALVLKKWGVKEVWGAALAR